ncbi:hypothetical protein, partial [Lentzea sp. NBRC 105346]|uniref:hypothetical protein n=1 Tax=Lentzea sp. NBRC 105346 TaxID=3032205 RepID=UPI002556D923
VCGWATAGERKWSERRSAGASPPVLALGLKGSEFAAVACPLGEAGVVVVHSAARRVRMGYGR